MPREDIIHLLQHHGVRPTANRILIAACLAAEGRPLSLTELETALESVDKSNISRALALFREQHLVHVLEDGSDSVRYELCRSTHDEEDDDAHVHFYCERCRRTFCLENTAIPPVPLPEGYTAESVNYMVKGVCPACGGYR